MFCECNVNVRIDGKKFQESDNINYKYVFIFHIPLITVVSKSNVQQN